MGTLSSIGTDRHYARAFHHALENLASGGVFLCATWVLADRFARSRKLFNDYVDDAFIERLIPPGIKLLERSTVTPENVERYKRVEFFAVRKRS